MQDILRYTHKQNGRRFGGAIFLAARENNKPIEGINLLRNIEESL